MPVNDPELGRERNGTSSGRRWPARLPHHRNRSLRRRPGGPGGAVRGHAGAKRHGLRRPATSFSGLREPDGGVAGPAHAHPDPAGHRRRAGRGRPHLPDPAAQGHDPGRRAPAADRQGSGSRPDPADRSLPALAGPGRRQPRGRRDPVGHRQRRIARHQGDPRVRRTCHRPGSPHRPLRRDAAQRHRHRRRRPGAGAARDPGCAGTPPRPRAGGLGRGPAGPGGAAGQPDRPDRGAPARPVRHRLRPLQAEHRGAAGRAAAGDVPARGRGQLRRRTWSAIGPSSTRSTSTCSSA